MTQPVGHNVKEETNDTGVCRGAKLFARKSRLPGGGWSSRTSGLTRLGWWWTRLLHCGPEADYCVRTQLLHFRPETKYCVKTRLWHCTPDINYCIVKQLLHCGPEQVYCVRTRLLNCGLETHYCVRARLMNCWPEIDYCVRASLLNFGSETPYCVKTQMLHYGPDQFVGGNLGFLCRGTVMSFVSRWWKEKLLLYVRSIFYLNIE